MMKPPVPQRRSFRLAKGHLVRRRQPLARVVIHLGMRILAQGADRVSGKTAWSIGIPFSMSSTFLTLLSSREASQVRRHHSSHAANSGIWADWTGTSVGLAVASQVIS